MGMYKINKDTKKYKDKVDKLKRLDEKIKKARVLADEERKKLIEKRKEKALILAGEERDKLKERVKKWKHTHK